MLLLLSYNVLDLRLGRRFSKRALAASSDAVEMELVPMLKVVGTVRNEAFVQCSVSGPSLDTLSRTDYKADQVCSSRGFGAAFPASAT